MWRVAGLALIVGCSGAAGGVDGGAPAGDAQVGDAITCSPFAGQTCFEGNSYWQDSCGQRGDLADECESPSTCLESTSRCCLASVTGNFQGYSNGARIRTFLEPGQLGITFTIDVTQATIGGPTLLQAAGLEARVRGGPTINNQFINLDLSSYTSVAEINGPVVFFSLAGIVDQNLVEAGPGAATLPGGAGGTAIFLPLDWTTGGVHRIRLAQEQAGADYLWAAYVMPPSQAERLVGRFNVGTTRPDLAPNATQLRSAAVTLQGSVAYADFPILEVAFGRPDIVPDGFNSAVIEYQALANTDATYDSASNQVRVTSGAGTPRCGPEQAVFTGP